MSILWLDGHSLGDHSSPFVKYSLIPQDWLVKIDQVCDLEPALTFTVFLNIRAACVGLCVAKVCSVRNNRGSVLPLFLYPGRYSESVWVVQRLADGICRGLAVGLDQSSSSFLLFGRDRQ
jgi:hypothetical protein